MPYTGPSDPSLPPNVKKLPPKKKRQWIHVFNSTFASCRSPSRGGGRGSIKKCESMAFRFANGAVKELEMLDTVGTVQCVCKEKLEIEAGVKEATCGACDSVLTLSWPDATKEDGDKCHDAPCAVIDAVRPYGGAQSFGDVDAWRESLDLDINVQQQKATFDGIWDNVWADEALSIDDKRRRVGQALVDLAARIVNPPEGRRSLVDKVKNFLHLDADGDDLPELDAEGKAAVPSHKGPISQQATWDAVVAVRRARKFSSRGNTGKKEDMNWATYAKFFAAVDPADRESFGGYSYPHHDVQDGKMVAVRGGVRAAFQRARQQDAADAIRHIQPHREQFGFKDSAFLITKDLDNKWRWLAIHTNKFEDEEGEGFTEAAHKEFETWVGETGNYPELWLWHTKGSRIGIADLITCADGFVLSSGVFDPGCEEAAKALAEIQDGLGVSHGFYHPEDSKDDDGFYRWYRTFEISPLPQEHAANLWTEFSAARTDQVKEVSMVLDPEKKAYLVTVLGQNRADQIEEALPKYAKELEEAGVNFKSLVDGLAVQDGDGDGANGGGGGDDEADTADDSEGGDAGAGEAAGEGKEDDGEEGEGEGKGDGEESKELTEQIATAIAEAVGPRLKAIEDRLGAVEKSDDEKVAEAMAPKGRQAANRPSQSDANALDGKAAEDIQSVLDKATDADGKEKPPVNPVAPYVEDMAATLTRGRK